MGYVHVPVLLREALEALSLTRGDTAIDATLGLGGHAARMLDAVGPTGRLLGVERTDVGAREARKRLSNAPNLTVVEADFRHLGQVAAEAGLLPVDGILFDLGLASWQIDSGHQGLSFQIDSPLDMRLSPIEPSDFTRREDDPTNWTEDAALARTVRTWRFRSAANFLGGATEEELSIVLAKLGDVRGARTIAKKLIESRPLTTTTQLVSALGTNNPEYLAPIFQALRILTNDEYGALVAGLTDAWQLLGLGGRLVVISFHSGEDRIVKRFMKGLSDAMLTDPVKPSTEEVQHNPRSRSAILRSARKASDIRDKA